MQMRSSTERQHLVSRVKALAETLDNTEISELELTEGGTRIVIKRQLHVQMVATSAPGTRTRSSRRSDVSAISPAPPAADAGVPIAAPLTGVYYEASSPSSPPFIRVGEPVQAGQVVCILEAMKVFNEIKAEVSGVVTAILPQNGQLVQKGDPIVRIRLA
jgi:acetyl-CoA carboxylase biotin carboxyl carrier protein